MDYSFKDIIEENKRLLDNLYKDSNEENGENNRKPITTIDVFRSKILDFIGTSLGQVERSQALLDLVDAKIINGLLLNEYDKKELLQLRSELVQATNTKTSVLLEPFKPTNTSGNSLITPPSTSEEGENGLKNITPKERQAIDKLYRLLERNQKIKEEKDKAEDAETNEEE